MVYWGCGTDRNRLAWMWVGMSASAGAALFVMGAAKLNDCNHADPLISACSMPSKAMLIGGAVLMVLALPPLLFFKGCAAPPEGEEQQLRQAEKGRSGITVVKQGNNGVSLHYLYDAAGRLVIAPDRHTEEAVARSAAKAKDQGAAAQHSKWDQQDSPYSKWSPSSNGSGGVGREAAARLTDTYLARYDASIYHQASPVAPQQQQQQHRDAGRPHGRQHPGASPLRALQAPAGPADESDIYSLSFA